jgi:sterol desaturase/sphingolipid hydroxylase (fatty acid hydroxylase superfamily)
MSKASDTERQLRHEYELARQAFAKAIVLATIVLIVALMIFFAALYAFLQRGEGFLSGNQLVAIILIFAILVIIIFAFIFERASTLKAMLTNTRKQLEINIGRRVREK